MHFKPVFMVSGLAAALLVFLLWPSGAEAPRIPDPPRGGALTTSERDDARVGPVAAAAPITTDRFPIENTDSTLPRESDLRLAIVDEEDRPRQNIEVIAFTSDTVLGPRRTDPCGMVRFRAFSNPPRVLLYDWWLIDCRQLLAGDGKHRVQLSGGGTIEGRILVDGRVLSAPMIVTWSAELREAARGVLPAICDSVLLRVPETRGMTSIHAGDGRFHHGDVSQCWRGAVTFPPKYSLEGHVSRDWSKGPRLELRGPSGHLNINLRSRPSITGHVVPPERERPLTWMRLQCVATVMTDGTPLVMVWDAGVEQDTRRFHATLGSDHVARLRFDVFDSSKRHVGSSKMFYGPFDVDLDLGDVLMGE